MKTTTHMFTFGTSHVCSHPDYPSNLSNHWVAVELPDGHHRSHRAVFMEEFTEPFCGGATKFAFEYTENEHKPEYFPRGELLRIKEGLEE